MTLWQIHPAGINPWNPLLKTFLRKQGVFGDHIVIDSWQCEIAFREKLSIPDVLISVHVQTQAKLVCSSFSQGMVE